MCIVHCFTQHFGCICRSVHPPCFFPLVERGQRSGARKRGKKLTGRRVRRIMILQLNNGVTNRLVYVAKNGTPEAYFRGPLLFARRITAGVKKATQRKRNAGLMHHEKIFLLFSLDSLKKIGLLEGKPELTAPNKLRLSPTANPRSVKTHRFGKWGGFSVELFYIILIFFNL